jgi:hypothetical protein
MLAVEVVVVEPWVELLLSFEGGLVSTDVGPFAESGLDEALGLSVCAWSVRPGEAVLRHH